MQKNIIKKDGVLYNYQLRIKKADGTPIWVIISIKRMLFNGKTALFFGFYDISERKKSEENLLIYRKKLRSMTSELSLAEKCERHKIAMEIHNVIG